MHRAESDATLADVVELLQGIGRILQVIDGRLEGFEILLEGDDDGED